MVSEDDDIGMRLRAEFDAQAKIVAEEQSKLARIDAALRAWTTKVYVDPSTVLRRHEYSGMGIVEATSRYLAEVGGRRSTRDIADAIVARGVTTRSKKWVPTVYATLNNAPEKFKREGNFWTLKARTK